MPNTPSAEQLVSSKRSPWMWEIRGAIAGAWLWGIFSVVRGGFDPGFYRPGYEFSYPLVGVVIFGLFITAETGLLYAIIRPASYERSWWRGLLAFAVLSAIAFLDLLFVGGWTDLPGYAYGNIKFLFLGYRTTCVRASEPCLAQG